MKADPILIQRPERQTPVQKLTFAIITMLAWTFWVSLWLPVITLVAWLLGLQDAFTKLGLAHPLHSAGDLGIILIAGLACALTFGSWSFYNHQRFSGRQKRRGNQPFGVAETAKAIGASVHTAEQLQSSRCLTIHFTHEGHMYLPSNKPASASIDRKESHA
jgi:biofilm PGA synthesis protein PgaD